MQSKARRTNLDVCQLVIWSVSKPFGKCHGKSELNAGVKRDHHPAATPVIASGDGMPRSTACSHAGFGFFELLFSNGHVSYSIRHTAQE
jgi:hypothetical protein